MKTHLYMIDSLTHDERFSFQGVDYHKYVFLTVEIEIAFGDKIKIGEKTYCSCQGKRDGEDYYLGVYEYKMKDDDEIDTEYEDEITCPACGNKTGDSWESSESDDNYECEQCGSVFSYEREVEVSYSSSLVKKNDVFVELEADV